MLVITNNQKKILYIINYFERQQKIDEIFRGLIEKLESSGKASVIRAKRINDDWPDDRHQTEDDAVTFPIVFRILFRINQPVVGDGEYTITADEHLWFDCDELTLSFAKLSYEYSLEEVTADEIVNDLIEFINGEINYVTWANGVKDYLNEVNKLTGDKEFKLDDYCDGDDGIPRPKIKCVDNGWYKLFSFDVEMFTDLQKIYEDIKRYSSFYGVDFWKNDCSFK